MSIFITIYLFKLLLILILFIVWKRSFFIVIFCLSLLFSVNFGSLSSNFIHLSSNSVHAQNNNPSQLVNQGIKEYEQNNYQKAITLWESALNFTNNLAEKNIILENLARSYQQLNQTEKALNYWQEIEKNAHQLNNLEKIGQGKTEQAQIYLNLGQTEKVIALLCGNLEIDKCENNSALKIAENQENLQNKIAVLGTLGEAYRLTGNYDQSIELLNQALSLSPNNYQASLYQSLGNSYIARGNLWQVRVDSASKSGNPKFKDFQNQAQSDYENAQRNFNLSLTQSQVNNNSYYELNSLLALIRLAYIYEQNLSLISPSQINNYLENSLNLLTTLNPDVNSIYNTIELANLPSFSSPINISLNQCPSQWQLSNSQRKLLLEKAVNQAQSLNNARVESFALGNLGHFYECEWNLELRINNKELNNNYADQELIKKAIFFTDKAILKASENVGNNDSLYLWQWQKGRLLQSQGQVKQAKNVYRQSFQTLESIRNELLTAGKDIQLDFRAEIEPIYRQLAELSLELAENSDLSPEKRQTELTQGLRVIDSLRLAELQNYLGNDCLIRAKTDVKESQSLTEKTAVINSVIFADKTTIIVTFPDNSLKIHWVNHSKAEMMNLLQDYRRSLLTAQLEINYDTDLAFTLYQEIIKPFQSDLVNYDIKTLVFVKDGLFRAVPMSALFDGKQFLIEQYAIATTPSLELTVIENRQNLPEKALILGLTQESTIDGQIFPPLENINQEIEFVAQQIPNNKPLVNQQFNLENLIQSLNNSDYPIIHIASHAQFGTIPQDTFIVSGNNQKITITDLEKTLRLLKDGSNSVELLSLTACQTAAGDDRSTLGLAGVAIQAGVKSAIASLWSVADESTVDLITAFYENLVNSKMSKAEALRQAQLKLIKAKNNPNINDQYDNPFYWSAFILIGNWG